MSESEVLITHDDNVYNVRVTGRVNVQNTVPLNQLADYIVQENIAPEQIVVDLVECTGMDSGFMGTLAKLGRRAKEKDFEMSVVNASPANLRLLQGLGVHKLLTFRYENSKENKHEKQWKDNSEKSEKYKLAKTLYDSHEIIHDLNPDDEVFTKIKELMKDDWENIQKDENPKDGCNTD